MTEPHVAALKTARQHSLVTTLAQFGYLCRAVERVHSDEDEWFD